MNECMIHDTRLYQYTSLNKEGHAACWTCPLQPSSESSLFLKRDVNYKAFAKVIGE